MPKPVIGITTGRRNHATAAGRRQTVTIGCPIEYVECLVRSGGSPVLLPRVADSDAVAA